MIGMYAYPDSKCVWGYRTVCPACIDRGVKPRYADLTKPIVHPPGEGKLQSCEECYGRFVLVSAPSIAA